MTYIALRKKVADRIGCPVTDVEKFMDAYHAVLIDVLAEGERVPLGRICRLRQVWRKAKSFANNLVGGKKIKKGPYITLVCKPTKGYKERMNPRVDT